MLHVEFQSGVPVSSTSDVIFTPTYGVDLWKISFYSCQLGWRGW